MSSSSSIYILLAIYILNPFFLSWNSVQCLELQRFECTNFKYAEEKFTFLKIILSQILVNKHQSY
jgi:hypothetical protein